MSLVTVWFHPCSLAKDAETKSPKAIVGDVVTKQKVDALSKEDTIGPSPDSDTAETIVPENKPSETTRPQSVVDIQTEKTSYTMMFKAGGNVQGEVELINLNPKINVWYLLKVVWPHKKKTEWFHLENIYPETNRLGLDESYYTGIVIKSSKPARRCDLWAQDGAEIKLAKYTKKPYYELCNGLVYMRNKIEGYRTTKEWVVEFLRDNVWGGETLTEIVKNTIYKDAFLLDSESQSGSESDLLGALRKGFPSPAAVAKKSAGSKTTSGELGIDFIGGAKDAMVYGKWYQTKHHKGAFVSIIKPNLLSEDILTSHKDYVKSLEKVEAKATSYLVAFDLSQYEMHFALGTEHPRADWSARVRKQDREAGIPGPDGFANYAPLAGTGLISPHHAQSVVATFTAGFKRSHGAFKWGKLAKVNSGSHYGFIENGVVMSKLQPGLATIVVDKSGKVDMKTWRKEDDDTVADFKYARQNGVPIIDYDPVLNKSKPGAFVSNWTLGNWSGSQDRAFRTLRAGACIKDHDGKQFLVYGYFSSVTPTAMARVFQGYGCRYGMHLDMNALEHTYLATYSHEKGKGPVPSQLIKGMKVLDERFKGNVPRFIGYPDNRDFFYLTEKGDKP
ncbi:MAG: hypothetical protein HRU19_22690 [Pseudobacteriovorax sp.]|nr:hypothetical protein [Pseudobacteriovorax sp.]